MIKKYFFILFLFSTSTLIAQQPPRQQSRSQPHNQLRNQTHNQLHTQAHNHLHRQPRNPSQQYQLSQTRVPIINNNYNNINIHMPVDANAANLPQSSIENRSDSCSSAQVDTYVESNNTSTSSSHSDAHIDQHPSNTSSKDVTENKNVADFFKHNKKRFIIGAIATLYGTIFYHVVQGNCYLRSRLRWSAWHKELSLKKLRKAPYYKLMAGLLCKIQKRYISTTKPTHFSAPLKTFMKELVQEEKMLRFYQKLYRWCSRLWIRKLFPFNVKLYRKIGVRLRRIRLLRQRFIKWITEYKIEHNETFKRTVNKYNSF